MKNQKGISTLFVAIIIILILLIVFGGFFVFQYFTKNNYPQVQSEQQNQNQQQQIVNQQTNNAKPIDQIVDWKLYTDPNFNFEIQYPSYKRDALGENIAGREILAFGTNDKGSAEVQITVSTVEFISKYLFGGGPQHSPCFLDNLDYNYENDHGAVHSTKININNVDFKKGDVTTYFEGMNSRRSAPVIEYCTTSHNGTVYVLDILFDTNKANSDILEKIISTFKFTK